MKRMVYLGIFVGGLIGGGVGTALDHGNSFGFWSIALGGVGSLAGIWAAVKLDNYI